MHKSVLLQETIKLLNLSPGDSVIDLTVGAGGHSLLALRAIGPEGKLLAIDKDETAIALAHKKLSSYTNVRFVHGDFRFIDEIASKYSFKKVNAIIADLGLSSMQLDYKKRGFSFDGHHRLDMRMNVSQKFTALDIIRDYSQESLTRIFKEYGEEPQAKRIAAEIVRMRKIKPIEYTDQLAEVVRRVKGKRPEYRGVSNKKKKIDPATLVFQALRIETNDELKALESALPQLIKLLERGGRMAIISFHSLEDRIVKKFMNQYARGCTCPPEFPKCVCGQKPQLKIITSKPVIPDKREMIENPRSRSAKLRVAEKI